MKIIIPMAGRGSRLRPHTLTVPKPMMPIAGKPIVQRLIEDLSASYPGQIEEVAFVTGDFGQEVDDQLEQIATRIGAKPTVYKQDRPLGTAHAILCAADSLSGHCIVAFADTLFEANFHFDTSEDGFIWVQQVEDPSAFGVVTLNEEGYIDEFVEKPEDFVSDLAIVGIYYFRDGVNLRNELQYLIDHDIKEKGEYQLTNALENMKQKGLKFRPGRIDEWLDCGNKQAVVHTNQRILDIKQNEPLISNTASIEDCVIIPPCFIGAHAVLKRSIIGPYVSIGHESQVTDSIISNSLVQNQSKVEQTILRDSMLGNHSSYVGSCHTVSLGDYTDWKNGITEK